MPYIRAESRDTLDEAIEALVDVILHENTEDSRAGLINYTISTLIARYLEQEGMTYNRLNSMIGALECAKLEIYRRLAAPYEDKKIEENGDVF